MFQVVALYDRSIRYHHITIIITLSHIIFNIFHDGMTDKIIVLKTCLIKLSNFRNVRFVERGKPVNPEKSLFWRKIRPGWLFNFKQWCESMPAVIGHYPWSIRTYRYMYMDEVMENLFSLYCSTWHAVSKMFVRFFQIKQVKASKKVEQELFIKKENGETETKRVLNNLRMPILHARKLHNSCHRVSYSLRESRCFAKCFRHFCFEQVKTLKNFLKKLFTS